MKNKTIPMCWKCRDAILGDDDTGTKVYGVSSKILVGCKKNKHITDYYYAKLMCPLINR